MKLKYTDVLIIALVIAWLTGLLASQLIVIYGNFKGRPIAPPWKRWDCFGLLPRFAFFSWVPNRHYELLFRGKAVYGEITPWNAVELPKRTWARALWNPGRRKRFAIEDLCRSFLSHMGSQTLNSDLPSPYCFSYLALAVYVSQIPSSPLTRHRQFMIAQVFGDAGRPPEVLFVSPFFLMAKEMEVSYAQAS